MFGLRIAVEPHLVGSKFAIQFGDGPVYVSPAMFDLLSHATPDELQRLVETIRIKKFPPLPTLSELGALPMATLPPLDSFAFENRLAARACLQ